MATPRPISRNPDRTRRRLLQAAIKLFAARGYHGVAVDQIVAAARVNKRMVYHYFGSKDAIFEAALHEVYGRIDLIEVRALESGRTPRAKLSRLLESYSDFLDANEEFTQLLQWANLEKGRHLPKQDNQLSKNPFLERFREIVDEGMQQGVFRPDLNVPHLLIHLIGLCFIYHSNRFSLSQGLSMNLDDPKVRARGIDQALRLVFDGITTPGSSKTA